jgi:hypothetical protein
MNGTISLAVVVTALAILGLVLPIAWLVCGPTLLAIGVGGYRRFRDPTARVLAFVAIVLGTLMIVVFAVAAIAFLPA